MRGFRVRRVVGVDRELAAVLAAAKRRRGTVTIGADGTIVVAWGKRGAAKCLTVTQTVDDCGVMVEAVWRDVPAQRVERVVFGSLLVALSDRRVRLWAREIVWPV